MLLLHKVVLSQPFYYICCVKGVENGVELSNSTLLLWLL